MILQAPSNLLSDPSRRVRLMIWAGVAAVLALVLVVLLRTPWSAPPAPARARAAAPPPGSPVAAASNQPVVEPVVLLR
jgi:hypothetical protein